MFDWLINFHFKKIMSLPKINEITWNQLVIIIIIACLCRSDCPISYYPEATFIGSIQANIDSSTARVKQQQFAYNLVQPLTSSSPKVAIMINGLSYRSQGSINFNIFYKPTPSFSQLIFLVNVTQTGKNKWQWVRFSFFASQNKIFQLGQQTVNSFTNTQIDSKKLIASKLPLDNNYEKPVLKIFLNGLSVNSTVTKEEVTQIRTQIQGYRSLTWSASVVKYLEKRLVEREILQALLYNMVLENRTLSFFVELGYKQVMEFISFSYVIFTNDQTVYHNEFIQSRFTQNFDTMINAPALQHMDLFIIGIEGLKFKQWEFLSMNPSLQIFKDNQTFSIKDVFTSQSNSFNLSYFALSKTKDSYCSHCRDGNIVYENFCVSECPESYVKKYNQIGQYCELCDIKQFKVPNALKTQCQCAMQYFSIAVKNTSQFTCSACNYQCLTCQSEYKCLTCDTNYLNTFRVLNQTSNQCVCSSGYYDDGSNNIKCLKCHNSCLTCRGPSQFDCETCPKGKTRGIDGNCICEGNFIEKNGICVCESPNFNYKGYCFTFLSKNKCTENQVSITLSDGSSKCQCKSGFQRFKTICVPCGQNQRVDQQTGKCVCKQNFYKDEEKNTCVACTQGKLYNDELKKCVCMKGSFQTSDGRCVTCRRRQTLINNECQCIFNYFKNDWGQCQRCQVNSTRPECMPNYR